LRHFDCIVFGAGPERGRWKVTRAEATQAVKVRARLVVNDFEFVDEAARAGLGVAMLPAFRCVAQLRDKTLRRVLPDWCSASVPVHAVYPTTRQLSPTVKAFLDHLSSQLTPPSWELGPAL
jgi:DNA-binding transcriptional LysR family regulator